MRHYEYEEVVMKSASRSKVVRILIAVFLMFHMSGCVSFRRTGQLFVTTRENHRCFECDGVTWACRMIFGFPYFVGTYTAAPVYDTLCMPYDLFLKCRGSVVRVLDEDGHPAAGVKTKAWFNGDSYCGVTDSAGELSEPVDLGRSEAWGIGVLDSRFYKGTSHREGCEKAVGMFRRPDRTVTAQRVEHPIPLFVKSVLGHDKEVFPKGKNELLFDCFEGDWLPPVGHGKVADIKFTRFPTRSLGLGENCGLKAEAYRDSMAVEFLGKDNGIVEVKTSPSWCLKIRTAPEEGYVPGYLCWKGRNLKLEQETNYDENRCFCFRIRARRDENGRIVEAYYGKIYRDISFNFSTNPLVPVAAAHFFYYLNPKSLDRNLEWDRKTNLCLDQERFSNHRP